MINKMRKIFAFPLILLLFLCSDFNAQNRNEIDPYREFLAELSEYRKVCRNALKPYRYDGSKTTHFSYKEYDYRKEVEIGTDEQTLVKLANKHEIVKDILAYRQQKKLQSTYVLALPKLLSSKSNRLHTTFMQTVAATGRLSSTNPNIHVNFT